MQQIQVSNKWKEFLWGLIMVVLISAFTYTVVKIYNEKSDIRHEEALERINNEAAAREAIADAKRDAAEQRDLKSIAEINLLLGEVQGQRKLWFEFTKDHEKDMDELKQFKNEKNYIPDNATTTEQLIYVTDYKYQPF